MKFSATTFAAALLASSTILTVNAFAPSKMSSGKSAFSTSSTLGRDTTFLSVLQVGFTLFLKHFTVRLLREPPY